MNQTFFSNPLWQKFHGRALTVYRLSDGEHRLRDAHANILLKEFLPGDTRFETLAIGGKRQPTLSPDAGIIILGRPALFPAKIGGMLADIQPELVYRFASNERSHGTEYRSIVRRGLPRLRKNSRKSHLDESLMCQNFDLQRKTGTKTLTDNAIVYSGWIRRQPLMLLAGSSTVGSWAAVHYVTKSPPPKDRAIWQQDVQGIIRGDVWADEEAFEEINSDTVELLSPCRFWLTGGSRPDTDGWTREVLQLKEDGGVDGIDLRITVNGKIILMKARTYVPALVLLTWLSHRISQYEDGFCAEITSGEARNALFRFLQIRKDNPIDLGECVEIQQDGKAKTVPKLIDSMRLFDQSKIGRHICETLKELTVAIREAGGLAFAEENQQAPGNEARWTFKLISREIPHFFPAIR